MFGNTATGKALSSIFEEKIRENALYLLDEPENSLSAKKQLELKKLIEDSARFFGCQFLIATHSTFLLSLHGAKIYDLDKDYADVKKRTESETVRTYFDFFQKQSHLFFAGGKD